jgi:hypothetical protein
MRNSQSGESRLNNFNYGLNLIQFRFLDNNPPFLTVYLKTTLR